MKKYIISALIPGILAFSLPLWSMDADIEIAETTQSALYVKNKAYNKIELIYKLKGENQSVMTLDNGAETCLASDVSCLERLMVLPYGKWKGWASKKALSGGYLEAQNVAGMEAVQKAQKKGNAIIIKVKLDYKEAKASYGKGWRSYAIGMTRPYRFTIHKVVLKKTMNLTTVLDQFPQAKRALEEGKAILPRYILALPENASKEDIAEASHRESSLWVSKLVSGSEDEKMLANRAILFIEEAYKSLVGEKSRIDALIIEEMRVAEVYDHGIVNVQPCKDITEYDSSDTEDDSPEHRDYMRKVGFEFYDEM